MIGLIGMGQKDVKKKYLQSFSWLREIKAKRNSIVVNSRVVNQNVEYKLNSLNIITFFMVIIHTMFFLFPLYYLKRKKYCMNNK